MEKKEITVIYITEYERIRLDCIQIDGIHAIEDEIKTTLPDLVGILYVFEGWINRIYTNGG